MLVATAYAEQHLGLEVPAQGGIEGLQEAARIDRLGRAPADLALDPLAHGLAHGISVGPLLPQHLLQSLQLVNAVGLELLGRELQAGAARAQTRTLAEASANQRPGLRSSGTGLQFSTKQLEAYGIYELQTLEKVLREKGPNAYAMRKAVCERIQRKIGWRSAEPVDSRRFLEAFYSALRAHLEANMLLGVRRKDKFDRPSEPRK